MNLKRKTCFNKSVFIYFFNVVHQKTIETCLFSSIYLYKVRIIKSLQIFLFFLSSTKQVGIISINVELSFSEKKKRNFDIIDKISTCAEIRNDWLYRIMREKKDKKPEGNKHRFNGGFIEILLVEWWDFESIDAQLVKIRYTYVLYGKRRGSADWRRHAWIFYHVCFFLHAENRGKKIKEEKNDEMNCYGFSRMYVQLW